MITFNINVCFSSAPEDVRRHLMEKWQVMLEVRKGLFDLKRFLSSERQMLHWRTEGLPSDQVKLSFPSFSRASNCNDDLMISHQLSVENAMSILNCRQSVFIVDPSNRATEWIKNGQYRYGGSHSILGHFFLPIPGLFFLTHIKSIQVKCRNIEFLDFQIEFLGF